MAELFHIADFDDLFRSRMTAAEWDRILVFRDHPNFMRALKTNADVMPQYFADNLLLNKVVTEAWRFEMLVYALYLFETRDPKLACSGLTFANLKRLCAQQKCASAGRVMTILSIMRLGGFLHQKKSETDARVKYLEPSARFLATVEGWNNRVFRVIDSVFDDENLVREHETNPRLGSNMRVLGAEGLLEGWKLLDPFPEVNHFVSSDGGWMLLIHCVAEALRSNDGSILPVSVDLAAYGKRFGVSRSHLRRLLETAYAEGLLLTSPRNGSHILLSPRLIASYLTCLASEMAYYRSKAIVGREFNKPLTVPGMAPSSRQPSLRSAHSVRS